MENNNPNGENINQNPVAAPTVPPAPAQGQPVMPAQEPQEAAGAPAQPQAPQEGGMNADMVQTPAGEATEAVPAGNPSAMPMGAMPAGASLRPETMQSQKVTKSIKLPGAKKSHKGLVAVIIIVLVLALGAGAAWWFLMGPGKGTDDEKPAESVVEDVEIGSGEETIEFAAVDLADVRVQKAYGNFANMYYSYGGNIGFYLDADAMVGNVSREWMGRFARDFVHDKNGGYSACKGVYYYNNDPDHTFPVDECATGDEMRAAVFDIFDEELNFEDGEKIRTACVYFVYNAQNDEFYMDGNGCGGNGPFLAKALSRAEEDGERLYLYENLLVVSEGGLVHLGQDDLEGDLVISSDELSGIEELKVACDGGDYEGCAAARTEYFNKVALEQGDVFKWTFKKMDDGRLVYESLERV